MIDKIIESFPEETFLKADGFDDAIIGVVTKGDNMILVYSIKKCIKILMEDMPESDAWEHFNFNVEGSYVGEKTPIFCYDYF